MCLLLHLAISKKPALNFCVAALLCSVVLSSFDVPAGGRKIGLSGVF